jgi:NAD(P)-dependent dehydrogenase (short-subunit alcohol dehydrogenase family)/acyl dehydratase
MRPEAAALAAEELRIGLAAEFEREIGEADVLEFAHNSGDHNPLHVDVDYAQADPFGRRIAHGALQVGLASALIGMHLPGRDVLLNSINARFPTPLYYPCRVRIRGEIAAWDPATRSGQLRVTVLDLDRSMPTAEIAMGFAVRGRKGAAAREPAATTAQTLAPADGHRVVLVTGGSGGIGADVIRHLAGQYAVLAMTNRCPLPGPLAALPGVREVRVNLEAPGWEEAMRDAAGIGGLYGIVHSAWPGAPHGGLLKAQDDVVRDQVTFGSILTVRLARLLYSLAGPEGGRFIAIGSVAGTMRPSITLAAYSLGKATLEATMRLLAPELARRQITVNTICPSFVPVGMSGNVGEPQRKIEASRVPLGRLCSTDDIIATVAHLLSPASAFLSGQVIGLTGGQL